MDVMIMKEKSHVALPWFSLGQIVSTGSGFVIRDLIVRWNETVEIIDGPEQSQQYAYDAYKFDLELPVEVEPGQEAVEYYLEQAKTAILALAQSRLAQCEGFA